MKKKVIKFIVCAVIYLIVLPILVVAADIIIKGGFTPEFIGHGIGTGIGAAIGFIIGLTIAAILDRKDDEDAR